MGLGAEGINPQGQTGLVPGRFVFMHDALIGHAINDRNCLGESRSGSRLIRSFDGRLDLLDVRPNHRALRCVSRATGGILTRAFARLGAICHAVVLTWSGKKERDNMQVGTYRVN